MRIIYLVSGLVSMASSVAAQNVGIGTASPSEKLHVNGNIKGDTIKPNAIKLSTNAGNGKILTSDASGNASWQERTNSAGSAGFGAWGDCSMNNITEYYPVGDTGAAVKDSFGHCVAMSGNYTIVGAPYDDIGPNTNQGSVNIYQFDGTNWLLDQKLIDTAGAAGDQFGKSVAISGNFLIVGSNLDDEGNADQGSACIYLFNGTEWEFMQKITDPAGVAGDNFGYSVSVSGNYLIVGVPYSDVIANYNHGSACIYQFDGVNWTFMQKIISTYPNAYGNFGYSVSIYGNNTIIGAPLGSYNIGYTEIYQFNGSDWAFKIRLSGSYDGVEFGKSVSINDTYAIVGATRDFDPDFLRLAGAAHIYRLNDTTWSFLQKVYDINGEGDDNFGSSVSISGNYLVIGAYKDKIGQSAAQGSAVIYKQAGPGWKKLQFITEPGGSPNDNFGSSAAIDGNTRRFVIGEQSYLSNTGLVVFGKVNN